MSALPWTDARIELLKTLSLSGLSASQVARALGGVTRNAVIGKLHRLGVAGRSEPAEPRPVSRRTPAKRPKTRTRSCFPRASIRAASGPEVADAPGLVPDLTNLGRQDCRWPIGDPGSADFSFCGRAAVGGRPYCADHERSAHRAGEARLEDDPYLRRLLSGVAA